MKKSDGEYPLSEERMTVTEAQRDIMLYVPKSNVMVAVLMGLCMPLGLILPFFVGWQLLTLLAGLFLFIIGIWLGPVLAWQLLHHAVLLIDEGGIRSQHPFFRSQIKWEEIDAMYQNGTLFAVDLSPAGLISFFSRQGKRVPRHINSTVPQLALGIRKTNLPLPVNQILTLIRERFSAQLERYHITLDNEGEESTTD